MPEPSRASRLADALVDARARTLTLLLDLDDERWRVPQLPCVNPLAWELGHVAWFQDYWIARQARGLEPLHAAGDALYDSARVAHATRWELELPDRADTLRYAGSVLERVLDGLAREDPAPELAYFLRLALFHEDMHGEALAMTRQRLGYPRPAGVDSCDPPGEACAGEVELAGGAFPLGAARGEPFVFDNEKWAHEVELAPFRLARAPVSQAEYAAFVEDGGYERRAWWTDEGWSWRERVDARHPLYWRRDGARWWRREFDTWVELEEHLPVSNVCAHEADAYARWAGARLPTEAEWELAASAWDGARKRRFAWGDEPAGPALAHLDGARWSCVGVGAKPDGDAPCGARQMFGNVWEWTSSAFVPYPGFVRDPYAEYSEPWFGSHRVLRGGSFATRSRLVRATWRNFYTPERRDPFAGVRLAR